MIAYLLQGLTLGFTNSVSPGPFLAYLLSQTLAKGWRHALPLTLAPFVTDGPIIALALLVLSQTPAWFLRVLEIGGGGLLIFLAWGAWQVFRRPAPEAAAPSEAGRESGRDFLKAVGMNATSPGPYLFWSTVGAPTLIAGWAQSPGLAIAFAAGFYLTLIGGLVGYILLFATASRIDPRLTRALNLLSALALLGFGLYRIWQGLAGG